MPSWDDRPAVWTTQLLTSAVHGFIEQPSCKGNATCWHACQIHELFAHCWALPAPSGRTASSCSAASAHTKNKNKFQAPQNPAEMSRRRAALFMRCHFWFAPDDIFSFIRPNYQSCFVERNWGGRIYCLSNGVFMSFHIIINLWQYIIAASRGVTLNYLEGINLQLATEFSSIISLKNGPHRFGGRPGFFFSLRNIPDIFMIILSPMVPSCIMNQLPP